MIRTSKGRVDKLLMAAALSISLLGVVFLYSATWERGGGQEGMNPLVLKQLIWVLAGITLMFLISKVDYLAVVDLAYLLYGLNLLALVFLLLFGGERFGARRWISVGPFSLQPSEFAKITVILALASFIGEKRERIGTIENFLGAIILASPAFLLIFLQPDLGTSLVIIPVLFAILFICGERVRFMMTCIVSGLLSLPFLWGLLKGYQKSRLMVFINPDLDPLGAGYTIIQSKVAIGSGGLMGKGWLNGTQSHLRFLPERHTDFIFSVIGEEWGLVGALALLALYAVFIGRGISVVSKTTNIYGKAIAIGVITLISFQVIVNISMTIGLMPVVGLPLPAISYGGSNTMTTLIGAGLLLSISRRVNR